MEKWGPDRVPFCYRYLMCDTSGNTETLTTDRGRPMLPRQNELWPESFTWVSNLLPQACSKGYRAAYSKEFYFTSIYDYDSVVYIIYSLSGTHISNIHYIIYTL